MVRSFISAERQKFITAHMFSTLIRRTTTPTPQMQLWMATSCWMGVPMMSTSKLLTERTILALRLAVLRTYMGPPASAFAPGTRS